MNAMAAVVLGLLAVTAWAQYPKLDALIAQSAKGINDYKVERERELGRWAAANLERVLPIVHEPKLDAYMAQLGAALAKNATAPFTYTLTVYEDRRPGNGPRMAGSKRPAGAGTAMPMDAFQGRAAEPVAVAGGPIFIPLSLLAAALNESEFAFQLAHAMAHIALRHATKLATRTDLMGLDLLRAQNVALADRRDSGAIPLSVLAFSRAFERQADYVALRIVSLAGYSPESMAVYLSGQTATEKAPFSAHPASGERAKAIRHELEKLPAGAYGAATGGFDEAREMAGRVR
jgi:predicted Zn-dependent protease